MPHISAMDAISCHRLFICINTQRVPAVPEGGGPGPPEASLLCRSVPCSRLWIVSAGHPAGIAGQTMQSWGQWHVPIQQKKPTALKSKRADDTPWCWWRWSNKHMAAGALDQSKSPGRAGNTVTKRLCVIILTGSGAVIVWVCHHLLKLFPIFGYYKQYVKNILVHISLWIRPMRSLAKILTNGNAESNSTVLISSVRWPSRKLHTKIINWLPMFSWSFF